MKNVYKILITIGAVLVGLLLLVMALSPVAKWVVNKHGQDIVGRDLSVNRLWINPFSGSVILKDFHCKEQNELTDFIQFSQLNVRINWLKLIAKRVDLTHIYLDDFSGEILNSDSCFNFTDIIQRFSKPDSIPQDTTPSDWIVELNDIRLTNGNLMYRDVVRDKQWTLNNVNLNVPGLYFGAKQSNAGLEFELPSGGSAAITAGYIASLRRYAVTVRLHEVNTNVALPLIQDYLRVSGVGALVSGHIHLDGSLDNVRDVVAEGAVNMTGLNITDESDKPVAGIEEMSLVIEKGDLARNTYLLDTLSITGITGTYEQHDDRNTLSDLLIHAASDTLPQTDEIESAPSVPSELTWAAKHLLISGKNLVYRDLTMKKDFEYRLSSFSLTGNNVASSGKNILQLKADLMDKGHLFATYKGGLHLQQGDHHLDVKMTGVDVKDFTAYTEYLMGYPLDKGILAYQSTTDILDGKLNSQNKISIEQMKVGKKLRLSKPKYKNIPLQLGVKLLTSAQGFVILDVPVTGDISSPKFKLGKVIGRAICKVFFGPLMGVRDNRELITEDEVGEMMELLGDDTISADIALPADSGIILSEVAE